MLEQVRRVNIYQANRDVAPVSPYPRINPKQERQEGLPQQQGEPQQQKNSRQRRRFDMMREVIETFKNQAQINRVDFNTAHAELIELGFSIVEQELLPQLLQLKVSLAEIEALIQQLDQQRSSPTMVSGRTLPAETLLPGDFDTELTEYLLRFDGLQLAVGGRSDIYQEINSHRRFIVERNRLRLNFSPGSADLPLVPDDLLSLTISIQLGAVEIDEDGRRAILYQRPDQSYGLYSDKSLNLSI